MYEDSHSGMLLNYSSEIAGLSSLTKLKEQERVENTAKKFVFPQQDDFINKIGRSSSAKLKRKSRAGIVA